MSIQMKAYLLERLKEPSTWRGFTVFLTAAGIALDPESIDYIVATGLGVAGLIGALTKDK